jgi:hypothetical protein
MSQLDPARYKKLTVGSTYGSDDGLYHDTTNDQICVVLGDTILTRFDATGMAGDLEFSSEANGDILVRVAGVWTRLAKGLAYQALAMPAAADVPAWANPLIGSRKTSFSAALVIDNTTPLVILDHSVMVTAGLLAAGDAIIFHGAILQLSGGAAAYDNNNTIIAKYQTAGGGATASLTLTNWPNGKAAGVMTTLKPLATDIVPEIDQDIVLVENASPKAAAGDRLLKVQAFYSVYTPL